MFEINPFLNAATNDVGACVNPPDAGYDTWPPPALTAGKNPKLMLRQIVRSYASRVGHGLFSHIVSGAQRLPDGNTLICSDAEGHVIEVTPAGDAVWEVP